MDPLKKTCDCSGQFKLTEDEMFNYLYLHKERMIKSLKSMSVAYELTTLEVII